MQSLKEFLLAEAKVKTKSDSTDWTSIFKNLPEPQSSASSDSTAVAAQPEEPKEKPYQSPFKIAHAAQTHARMNQFNRDVAGDARRQDVEMDDVETAEPVGDTFDNEPAGNTLRSNMPATVDTKKDLNNALALRDTEPQWHMVKNLPAFMSSAIKELGREVFSAFTDTPIEEILVLANVHEHGPNEQNELDAVVTYLQREGTRQQDMEMEFTDKLPGYQIQVRIYTAVGHTFVTGKDAAGKYVYCWKTGENDLKKLGGMRDTQIGVDRPRLR